MAADERTGPPHRDEDPATTRTPPGFALSRLLTLDEQLFILLRDPDQRHTLRGEDSLLLAAAVFLEIARAGALHVEGRRLRASPDHVVARPHLAATTHRTSTARRKDLRGGVLRPLARTPRLWGDVEDSLVRHGIDRCGASDAARTPHGVGRWRAAAAQELRTYLTPVVAGASPFARPRLVLLAGLVCLTGLVDHLVPRSGVFGVAAPQQQAHRLLSHPHASHELEPRALAAQREIVSQIYALHEFWPSAHGGP